MRRLPFNGTAVLTGEFVASNVLDPKTKKIIKWKHLGEDYALSFRTAVYAATDGKIIKCRGDETRNWLANTASDPYRIKVGKIFYERDLKTEDYGNYVKIDHGKYDGKFFSTLYAHLSEIVVREGQTVKEGELIGYSDSTGNSTGNHLHYETRLNDFVVDPNSFDYSFKGTMGIELKITKFEKEITVKVTEKDGCNIRAGSNTDAAKIGVKRKNDKIVTYGYCFGQEIDKGNNIWLVQSDNTLVYSGCTDFDLKVINLKKDVMTKEELTALSEDLARQRQELEEKMKDLESQFATLEVKETQVSDALKATEAVEEVSEPVIEETKVEEVKEESPVETLHVEPEVAETVSTVSEDVVNVVPVTELTEEETKLFEKFKQRLGL